jgi:hypothetical protein
LLRLLIAGEKCDAQTQTVPPLGRITRSISRNLPSCSFIGLDIKSK